jgi:hypothetical protein
MSQYREGVLTKNEIGRWEFSDYELTSGELVEVFVAEQWIRGRIEYLHGSQSYQLIISSGPDSETYVVLHTGMRARTPGAKIRPPLS